MGIIICQFCDQVIEYVHLEKVSTMYAACQHCERQTEKIESDAD